MPFDKPTDSFLSILLDSMFLEQFCRQSFMMLELVRTFYILICLNLTCTLDVTRLMYPINFHIMEKFESYHLEIDKSNDINSVLCNMKRNTAQ